MQDDFEKRRTYGQFDTPADVADLLLGFSLRRPGEKILDPSCGNGAFLRRAARFQEWLAPGNAAEDLLWGVELDPEAAKAASLSLPQAQILNRDFFGWRPRDAGIQFDVIVGNPPYTRSERIGELRSKTDESEQLAIFNGIRPASTTRDGTEAGARALPKTILPRRAGLHAYFFVHGTEFLREGGRFAFVVPNSWLDVAYGVRLKQFLLDHYRILAIIESKVERWFAEARVNTCLIILEKCANQGDRAASRIRLIRLRRALAELIPQATGDRSRLSHLESLTARLMPFQDVEGSDLSIRVLDQGGLSAGERWGVALRAPGVYRRLIRRRNRDLPGKSNMVPVSTWARIKRGYTTGANSFFYLDDEIVEQWSIESEFRRPLLKSLREVGRRTVVATDLQNQLLLIPEGSRLAGTAVADYIIWGESQGFHRRRSCMNRPRWFELPEQEPAGLFLAKGIWNRHFAPICDEAILVDQQVYQVYLADGVPLMAAAAMFNSAWFALQLELQGRVNFGEGVLWLAGYELQQLRLPDLRYWPPNRVNAMAGAMETLLTRPVTAITAEAETKEWLTFNHVVHESLGFEAAESQAIIEALLESVATRERKAATMAEANR